MQKLLNKPQSRDALIQELRESIQHLKAAHAHTPTRPVITASAARSIGETLNTIKALSRWGEFSNVLATVGLSQPMASICRRLAKDWSVVAARNLQDYSADVAYQKLIHHPVFSCNTAAISSSTLYPTDNHDTI